MKLIRGVSGLVAAGVVLLALVVVCATYLGSQRDFPGPGSASVTWHIAAAACAIVAQVVSDRKRGPVAFAGSTAVIGAAGLLLWTQWWN